MNTNSNVYTLIYTTTVVVIVAAVLAFAAMKLQPLQQANIKAETISQMMTAAGLGTKEEISAKGNTAVLKMYSETIDKAFVIDIDGQISRELGTMDGNIELIDNLKAQDRAIKNGAAAELPVYVFKSGVSVIPVYGAGLWGPIWGYLALESDFRTIAGAYFDHASETPGLGAKIKDEPWFQDQFKGKKIDFASDIHLDIVKGGARTENEVDAISGATMTSNGLGRAINAWMGAYAAYAAGLAASAEPAQTTETTETAGEGKDNE